MDDTFESALEALSSNVTTDRFNAARYFVRNTNREARFALERQRRIERVRHVRMALDKALSNIAKLETMELNDADVQIDDATDSERRRYLKAEAIDEFSGIILHELAPKLGMLKDSLIQDFDAYDESNSKRCVDKLFQIFKAIELLRLSASRPESNEVDLAQLIKDIIAEEIPDEEKSKISLSLEGDQPCIIKTDPALLSLAICNGIRNSYESLKELSDTNEGRNLVISWGVNDVDNWISIIDEGVGLRGNAKAAFKIGNTNKDGHTGFGMGIMSQAMDSLGGYAELSNVETGGAKLVLRWGDFNG